MAASSATACSTPPVPARSSPRRRPTRWSRRRPRSNTGAGVLFIVKNYEGDVMNFEMAAEMSEGVMQVITNDDVAVEDSLYTTGRRGVAGTLVVEKIVGAAAEEGMALADLKTLGDRVNAATRSMGVALTSCTVPAAGKPNFEIGDDEMEFGVGIHGEPGRRRDRLAPGRRHRRGDLHGNRRRSRCGRQGQGAAVRQRLRRHAADGALSDVQQRAADLSRGRASRSSARWSAPTSPRSTWPAARSR